MDNSAARWARLLLILAVLFGAVLRFAPTILARGPVNDGGMFYTMIEEIRGNGFRLPEFTAYNQLQIPFAYPPLSLYVGAFLSALGLPTIEVVRWLPALVSTLSIAAFYWMAGPMLSSTTKAAMAAMAYALMPRAYSWYVMGGGISRAFGIFFLLLACGSAWAMFTAGGRKHIILTTLFGAAAVLSHPETALHAAAAILLIWIFKGRSRRGLRNAAFVALGVLLFTSPWWASVLLQHGWAPFGSALSTGGHSGLFWIPWLTFDFAEERFVTVLTVLGLIGFAVATIRRDLFLPTWVLLPFVVEPRSATAIAALPLAMLAGLGLADLVIPGIASLRKASAAEPRDWTSYMLQSRAARVVVGYVVFSAFLGAYAYDQGLASYVIPPASRAAMQWVKETTPATSRFVVLTGRPDPLADPSNEWFPVLADRTSVGTIQGREWTLGPEFMPFLNSLAAMEDCLHGGPTCVAGWAEGRGLHYDYIYIEKRDSQSDSEDSYLLSYQLRQDPGYALAFENEGVVIFKRK